MEGSDDPGVSTSGEGLGVAQDGDYWLRCICGDYLGAIRGTGLSMTDVLTGKADAQRILAYVESVAKESRKALTVEFNQKHKGIPFNTAPHVLRDSLLAWFGRRDENLRLSSEATDIGRPGEVRAVFVGESKKVRFKVHADAVFTLAGRSAESPCYLKDLNVTIDRRAFST